MALDLSTADQLPKPSVKRTPLNPPMSDLHRAYEIVNLRRSELMGAGSVGLWFSDTEIKQLAYLTDAVVEGCWQRLVDRERH